MRRGLFAEIARFIRANISSTIASGVDWVVVTVLVCFNLYYLTAAAAGAVVGAVTDFVLKRYWAFDRTLKGSVHSEGFRYLVVSGSSLGWNLLLAYGLVDGLGFPKVLGVIAASLVVGFVWNYPLHRVFVFRQAHSPPKEEPQEEVMEFEEPRRVANGGRRR